MNTTTDKFAPPIHWAECVSAEPCSEDQYESQMCANAPAYISGDRYATDEPTVHTKDGCAILPVGFEVNGQHFWGSMPLRVLRFSDNHALLKIVSGEFVVRDGSDNGYVVIDNKIVARFDGDLISCAGLSISLDCSAEIRDRVMDMLRHRFDVVVFYAWNEAEYDICPFVVDSAADIS